MKLWNLLQLTLAWNFNHINKQEFFAISHGDEPGSDVEQMVTNSQQLFVNVSVEKLFGTIFFYILQSLTTIFAKVICKNQSSTLTSLMICFSTENFNNNKIH